MAIEIQLFLEQGLPAEPIFNTLAAEGLQPVEAGGMPFVVCRDILDPGVESLAHTLDCWFAAQCASSGAALAGPYFAADGACWRCWTRQLRWNGWRAGEARGWMEVDSEAIRLAAGLIRDAQARPASIGGFAELERNGRPIWHPIPRLYDCGCSSDSQHAVRESTISGVLSAPSTTNYGHGVYVARSTCSRRHCAGFRGGVGRCEPIEIGGKGATEKAALAGCRGEALERTSLLLTGDERFVRSSAKKLGPKAVPAALLASKIFDFDDSEEHPWISAYALESGAEMFVAAELCFLGFESRWPFCDTSGCASAEHSDEAQLRALVERVERDAVALWWNGRLNRPSYRWEEVESGRIGNLREFLFERNRAFTLLDLTTEFGLPVCAAISARSDGKGIAIGTGAGFSPEEAAWRAAIEMTVLVAEMERLELLPIEQRACQERLWQWWSAHTLTLNPHLIPNGLSDGRKRLQWDSAKPGQQLCHLSASILAAGYPVAFVDHTRAELAFPVFRAVVPGLLHTNFSSYAAHESRLAGLGENTNREPNPIEWFL